MKRLFSLFFAVSLCSLAVAQTTVSSLRVNRMSEPQGVADSKPMMSWIVESAERGVKQTAYEIEVYQGQRKVWDTGKVLSDCSTGVEYGGETLKSGTRYAWQVRVWDNKGKVSRWSARAGWLSGMLSEDEWQAKWIEPREQTAESPMLRREFTLTKSIASAVAYITAHGMYEAEINGRKVGQCSLRSGLDNLP